MMNGSGSGSGSGSVMERKEVRRVRMECESEGSVLSERRGKGEECEVREY
jgi:hypothetical protein